MVDPLSRKQRSYCMSRVRGTGTKPEMLLRKALWAAGLRYRTHVDMPGRPDIVFIRAGLVVFVDGCFWHNCPIHGSIPQSNRDFWEPKIQRNVERDNEVSAELEASGWTVLRFWEHEINESLARVVERIMEAVAARTAE